MHVAAPFRIRVAFGKAGCCLCYAVRPFLPALCRAILQCWCLDCSPIPCIMWKMLPIWSTGPRTCALVLWWGGGWCLVVSVEKQEVAPIAFCRSTGIAEVNLGLVNGCACGQVSYRSYWTKELLEAIYAAPQHLALKDLTELTGIRSDDVVSTLQAIGMVRYWKGEHILACYTSKIVEDHLRLIQPAQAPIAIRRDRVHYTPYLPPSASVRPRA